jgi:hypothetical protein
MSDKGVGELYCDATNDAIWKFLEFHVGRLRLKIKCIYLPSYSGCTLLSWEAKY